MKPTKLKSFTLSELLVVMIITVIVVGIAFSVLTMVQKQIHSIEKNFQKTTELSLFEQRLWQDFNHHNIAVYSNNRIVLTSDIDTVSYSFEEGYTLRNTDTIPVKFLVDKIYYHGREVKRGFIDAVSVSGAQEFHGYTIFTSGKSDATHFMNEDGF